MSSVNSAASGLPPRAPSPAAAHSAADASASCVPSRPAAASSAAITPLQRRRGGWAQGWRRRQAQRDSENEAAAAVRPWRQRARGGAGRGQPWGGAAVDPGSYACRLHAPRQTRLYLRRHWCLPGRQRLGNAEVLPALQRAFPALLRCCMVRRERQGRTCGGCAAAAGRTASSPRTCASAAVGRGWGDGVGWVGGWVCV